MRQKMCVKFLSERNSVATILLAYLPQLRFDMLYLGTYGFPNMDVFLEKFRRGGGVISDPKNYVADFLV